MQFLHRRLLSWLGFIPVAAVFVAMASLSWRKWGDLIVDFGANLYVPWQISEGKVLYRDMDWLFGPLSQYYHALIFKCFGVSLTPLIFSSLGLLALFTVVVYVLFLKSGDVVNAVIVSVVLLVVFAFPQYVGNGNYNYICPYRYEAVHGLFASAGVILFLVLWLQRGKTYFAALSGFFLGLVFLTKPEVFVAIAAAAAVALAIGVLEKKGARPVIAFLFCAVIPVAAFAIYFCVVEGVAAGLESALWNWIVLFKIPIARNKFYEWGLGLDAPWKNTLLMLRDSGVAAVVVAICFLCCRRRPGAGWAGKVVSVIILFALLVAAFYFDWTQCGRCLPLLMPVVCLHLIWQRRKCADPIAARTLVFPILWSVFAFVLLAKMGLNCRIWHYGFVLAMPAALSAIYYLGCFLPEVLQRSGVNARLFRATIYVLLGVCVASLLDRSMQFYRLRDFPVGKNGDTIRVFGPNFDPVGKNVGMVLDWLETNTPADATVVAIPHGMGINYLARRVDPVRYNEYLPHILDAYGATRIKADLVAAHPDYILLVHVDTSEYGPRFFGESPAYGAEIMEWINEAYEPVYLAGEEPLQNESFGIKILARKRDAGSR